MSRKTNTPAMRHEGYLVIARTGPMYFGLDDLEEAMKYCEPTAKPVKLLVDEAELAAHEQAQGEDDLNPDMPTLPVVAWCDDGSPSARSAWCWTRPGATSRQRQSAPIPCPLSGWRTPAQWSTSGFVPRLSRC